MALKDLLVCIDPTTAGDARLKLAFNLARANKAHLSGAYVLADGDTGPRGPSGFGMTGFTEEPSRGGAVSGAFHEAEVADRVELRFKDELRVAGIEGEWHVVPDGDSTALIEFAKSVDMTIMGQSPPRADGAARLRPDDVVMAAGRPVLVVPYAGTFETVGKRILVAWDGTREANRALNDALPLLEESQAAAVMFVGANERELEQHLPAVERHRRSSATARRQRRPRRNHAGWACDIRHLALARCRPRRRFNRYGRLSPLATARSPDWRCKS
jgi:hypothetical protein